MRHKISIANTMSEWVQLGTQTIVSQATQAIVKRGYFSLVLSGGSTPELIYKELALAYIQDLIDWRKCFIFWGDERCVPPENKESNYYMAKISLLDKIPIPLENIFRMRGEITPENAAMEYEQVINSFFLGREKRFDTILLGLGEDGHTASLFPGTKALSEKKHWVVCNQHPYSNSQRITLTYPAINDSRNIVFLVRGSQKSKIVADVIQKPNQLPKYPTKRIIGKENPPEWILDSEAGENLSNLENL